MSKKKFKSCQELVESWEEKMEKDLINRPHLVLNRIKTPDGTIITSYHVHDYVSYMDKNGKEYMVDGGLEYLRRNVYEDAPYEEMSVTTEAPFEQIRESMHWGTYGKKGDQPLRYVTVSQMSDQHIKAILNQKMGAKWVQEILEDELKYRAKKGITIND
jgi:hypothetical protein